MISIGGKRREEPHTALPCAHGPSRAASSMLPSMLRERSERADNKLDNTQRSPANMWVPQALLLRSEGARPGKANVGARQGKCGSGTIINIYWS